jgi:hypothetical protein
MTPKTTRFANVFALVALLGGPLVAQDQQVPTAEEVERIRAALPDKPSVAPRGTAAVAGDDPVHWFRP